VDCCAGIDALQDFVVCLVGHYCSVLNDFDQTV
jgi:hypothetical protein